MIADQETPCNGVVSAPPDPEGGPTALSAFAQLKLGLDVHDIASTAEDVQVLLQRFQHDPILAYTLHEHFAPLLDPLKRTLPTLDDDEASADYPYGDTFNARALVIAHRHELRYCPPWKAWLVWNGTHWERDTTGHTWRWIRSLLVDLLALMPQLGAEEAKAVKAHVIRSLQTPRIEGALKAAQTWAGISLGPEPLDADAWLLNCANGTLDLRTGTLRSHHPGDLLTKCLPIPYDPTATCPTWETFLHRIMGGAQGSDTPEMRTGELAQRAEADARAATLIAFHQRWLGYSLTGETREQCLCLLHGSGANGKSTYLETVRAVLGDYAQSTPSASLLAKERSDGIPNDIARLRGARLVTAVEIGEGRRLDEELLKRLTGQDMVTARFLRAEFFEFRPQFKLLVACNHLPAIRGTDHAIWRRIHCVPFTVTIPEAEQDKDLGAKLRQELPGILAWAVRGCLAWQQDGLQVPDVVMRTTGAYRSDMDAFGRFLEERCVRVASATTKVGVLYDAYKAWGAASGEGHLMTLTAMGKRLDDLGFPKEKRTYVYILGLGLTDTEHAEDAQHAP